MVTIHTPAEEAVLIIFAALNSKLTFSFSADSNLDVYRPELNANNCLHFCSKFGKGCRGFDANYIARQCAT
jgi:hypothetical protein